MEIKAAQFWASLLRAASCVQGWFYLRGRLLSFGARPLPCAAVLLPGTAKLVARATAPARRNHPHPTSKLAQQVELACGPTQDIRRDCICLCARKADPAPSQPPSLQTELTLELPSKLRLEPRPQTRCDAMPWACFQGPKVPEAPQPRVPSSSSRVSA